MSNYYDIIERNGIYIKNSYIATDGELILSVDRVVYNILILLTNPDMSSEVKNDFYLE